MREALNEREVLLRAAPHIVWPLAVRAAAPPGAAAGLDDPRRAVALRSSGRPRAACRARPRVDLRGRRRSARRSSLASSAASPIRTAGSTTAGSWSSTRSTRRERGAEILTRTRCTAPGREGDGWARDSRDADGAAARSAPGPSSTPPALGSSQLLKRRSSALDTAQPRAAGQGQPHRRAASSSEGEHAYILQNADRRIVFVIPYVASSA